VSVGQSPSPSVSVSLSQASVRVSVRKKSRAGTVVLMDGEEVGGGRAAEGHRRRVTDDSASLSHWRDFDALTAISSIEVSHQV